MSLTSIAASGSKALGDRFNLVNVVPASLPALALVIMIHGHRSEGGFDPIAGLPDLAEISTGGAVLFALGIMLLGLVIAPFQMSVVRLVEGYWGVSAVGLRLTEVGVELQRRKLAHLVDAMAEPEKVVHQSLSLSQLASANKECARQQARAAIAAQRRRLYPSSPSALLPTALGNILRAAETSAGERYGLGTVVTYPRLRNLLSARLDQALSQLLTHLDTAAALSVSFAISAVVFSPLLAEGWSAFLPMAAIGLSVMAYGGAKVAAAHHGQLLAAAFDLHRFDLLNALHYPLPKDPAVEHALNSRLTEFLDEVQPAPETMVDVYSHRGSLVIDEKASSGGQDSADLNDSAKADKT